MIQPVHRHSSARNAMLEGLNISGLGSAFGIASVVILLLVGGFLILKTNKLDMDSLSMVQATALNKPYQPGYTTKQERFILPVKEGGKLLIIENFAFKAADSGALLSKINAGDSISAWLTREAFNQFQQNDGGRQVPISLLSVKGTPIIDIDSYNSQLGANGSTGWWILALGLCMVPYFFINRPKIHPLWVFMAVIAAMALWYLI